MITVAMNAWPRYLERLDYFKTAVGMFRKWAISPVPLRWLVAAETSIVPDDVKDEFLDYCEDNSIEVVWHEGAPDLPSNQNLLFRSVRTPYAVYLQDDWSLNAPLDILPDITVMDLFGYDMVQYTWRFDPPEADVGNTFFVNNVQYNEIGTRQTWYYRDNPFIVNVRSLGKVGPFKEGHGVLGGDAEYEFACRAKGKLKIAGRGDGNYTRYFSHVGIKSSMTEKWNDYRQRAQMK